MSGSKSRNAALASFSTPDHGNSPPRMTLTTPKHMDGAAVDPIEKSSSLTSAQEIIAARGRALGVRSGAALAKYVQEEEAAQRRLLQEEEEAQLRKEEAQRRLLQEEEEAQLRKEEAQRRLLQEEEEAQLRKEEAQLRKEEAQRRLQREEQDAQRRLQREEEEIRRKVLREEEENDRRRRLAELEEERVRAEIEKTRREETTSSSRSRAIEPVRLKIDPFDEAKEDLDTFLGRFERAATLSGWDRESDWGARLGALLKGFAADVYLELPAEDAGNFDVIVDALRGSFRWTADSYRSKFRLAAKRGEETFIQFATRLRIWFERWRKAAKKEETYAGIRDLLLMEHLMDHVSGDLADFIRQREPANVTEAAELAERFAASKRARKNPVMVGTRVGGGSKDPSSPKKNAPPKPSHNNPQFTKGKCFNCGKEGHHRRNCLRPSNTTNLRTVVTSETSSDTSELPALCDPCSQLSYTPLCTVSINGSQVSALRDTGADGLVIDSSLVKDCKLKQGSQTIRLAAGNVQKTCPTTIVHLESPFFSGNVVAIVADQLTYPVLIGNRIVQPGGETLEVPVYRAEARPVKITAITRAQHAREKEPPKNLRMKDSGLGGVTREELIQLQSLDPTLSRMRELAKGSDPAPSGKKGKVKFLWKQGVLHRLFITTEKTFSQVVVPETLREGILRLSHDVPMAGHLGTKKTQDRLWHSFYWPGMGGDIRRYVQSCDACQRALPKGRIPKAHLGKMPLMDEPFRRIAVDIVGPLTVSERKNRYILVTVDYATRYPEATPLPSIEAERVAEALWEMYTRVGVPKEVLTDRGSQFVSDLMKQVNKFLAVKGLTTTPYHAQCNGLVERFNGTLKSMLKKLCHEKPRDWDRFVPALLFAYREVPQESLGFSPFELLYGRSVRGPLSLLKELWTKETPTEVRTTAAYVVDLRQRLEETLQLAQENLDVSSRRYAQAFDRRAVKRKFKIGSRVLLLIPLKRNKLEMAWQGPYEVVGKVGDLDYRLRVGSKEKLYHANLLKQYVERDPPSRTTPPQKAAGVLATCAVVVDEASATSEDDSRYPRDIPLPALEPEEGPDDVQCNPELTDSQREDVKRFSSRFRKTLTDLPGKTKLEEFSANLLDSKPVFVRPRPLPYSQTEAVKQEVEAMLKIGVIEPASSPYNAPVVLVKKKDGKIRFCIDYRQLNRVTEFDGEPLPDIDHLFSSLGRAKYFTKIDLSKGYWQIPVRTEDKPKLAFIVPQGQFQWTMMPFGLQNAVAVFSRMMRKLLNPLKRNDVHNFMDDILIGTEEWKTHLQALEAVFRRLEEAGLTARPTKCFVGFHELDYLGHRIGHGLMWPEAAKVEKIQAARRPETKKEVRAFLGLAGFYRRYVPNFAAIALPLTELTRKICANKVQWTELCEESFNSLRQILSQQPVICLPDLSQPFVLQTDASDIGLGAVLLQESDGELKPVSFASRKLNAAERNYATVEKECLAIVWGIRKFEVYLYGHEFELQTDHQSLQHLQKTKTTNGRLMRWALLLQTFTFRIRAIRGCDNVGADYYSRIV
ncbi:hypothetical protein V1264_009758 [Littorina saxatilis]|uniref:RNA-directed DNA polymerase n=1 Tax=Littorina saxatilis TaxID=31220 RepID=A0AAN9G262_9CAEN